MSGSVSLYRIRNGLMKMQWRYIR